MSTTAVNDLDAVLTRTPYQGYTYAYPHKTAYRPFEDPIPLRDLWAAEDRSALFLYVHVPFCEFRCGFCNLFTQTHPADDFVTRYLDALERQVDQVQAAVPGASFARFAVGGGTPTQLTLEQLERVFDLAERRLGAELPAIPVSCEMSPDTVDPEKLAFLVERGVDRASIGVQSFLEDEARAAGRPQRTARVEQALAMIREARFPVLNIDLIYGLPNQTLATWATSLEATLAWAPEEVFLYPLYVRPLTGLGKRGLPEATPVDDPRLALYRAGRERLLAAGYVQVSMRLFRRADSPDVDGPAYCCQEDGMIGLGCGARSYTRAVHYSDEYAVGARGVKEILADWVTRGAERFAVADYGIRLGPEEQRRRYAIQSLFHRTGLSFAAWRARFGTEALDDLPELAALAPRGLVERTSAGLTITPAGLERSDALGPWLYSDAVGRAMNAFDLR